MTWFDIFKKDVWKEDLPFSQKYTEIKLWLNKIFNVPLEELDKLNYPNQLVRRLRKKSNLEVIDEGKFTLLMGLSEQGRYQELLDVLDNMLQTASQERRKETKRVYRQTSPKYKEYREKYNERRRKNRKG